VKRVRVLIADASRSVRQRLALALAADPECEVVGEAEDGRRAFELCAELRPSVITLDVMLPGVDGLAATEQIMAFCPTPILIVSAALRGPDARKAWKALGAGAVDVLPKPSDDEPASLFDQRLVSAVKLVSRIKVITHLRGRFQAEPGLLTEARASLASARVESDRGRAAAGADRYQLIAVGASTGGPSAVAALLGALPATFPLPVLLVLHISSVFGATFIDWLGTRISLPVAFGVDRELLPGPGVSRVIMAPPDRHLVVQGGSLRLTADPERHSCRPSVDVLFESIAEELGPAAVGCLLTGMGRDGAKGLLAMKRAGAMTLAQDEATSIVFGMPREAIRLDAAKLILPLDAIGPAISRFGLPGKRAAKIRLS
jgi:two-component system, chemotaxis family, protein-glutamate methylesterase/glutaminase